MRHRNFFLSICTDKPNDPSGFIYFVNMSSEGIENLEYETTGYPTDDTELIESSRFYKSLGNLSANNFIEIENADEGSFDFTIYFG